MAADRVLRDFAETLAQMSQEGGAAKWDEAAATPGVSLQMFELMSNAAKIIERLRQLVVAKADAKLDDPTLTHEQIDAQFADEFAGIHRDGLANLNALLHLAGVTQAEVDDALGKLEASDE
jgi:hypothetical protein